VALFVRGVAVRVAGLFGVRGAADGGGGMSRTWEIRLPWTKPPCSANDRDHWRAKARKVAHVRATVLAEIEATEIPYYLPHIIVGLTYVPRDRRRRDADNLVVPFMKACVDAVVDACVVVDDDTAHVTRTMPVIAEPDGDPRLVLRIEEVP
jgi:crossover junction endodeoxyribonuclease RusA